MFALAPCTRRPHVIRNLPHINHGLSVISLRFRSSSVTVPGYQGNLQAAVSHSSSLAAWERFGVEFILTFIVVLAYLISTTSFKKHFGSSAIAIGAAYSACSFVSVRSNAIVRLDDFFPRFFPKFLSSARVAGGIALRFKASACFWWTPTFKARISMNSTLPFGYGIDIFSVG